MMYETETSCDGDYALSLAFRAEVEPLLYQYKVNLMLVGHQHSYERSCPALNGSCVPDGRSGTTHMVVGSAGATVQSGSFNRNKTKFSLVHANTYGYIRLDANATRLKVEFVRTNSHDGIKAGQVWDSVNLLPWV
jgi:acid phosphatase type 7